VVDWVPSTITLVPTTATLTECGTHTITATLAQGASPFAPLVGVSVAFDVMSGPDAGSGAVGSTDLGGQAQFSYQGLGGTGTDTIQASFVEASQTNLSNPVTATWQASSLDCNLNGLADQCETGWDQDCNGNGGPDLCDLAGAIAFDPPFGQAVDASPFAIAAADLDGLNGVDLVTASGGNQTVSVLLNGGGSSFAPAIDYPTDKASSSLTLVDLDGDGDFDVAAATQNDTVSVLLNNGDGTFASGGDVPTLGNRPTSITSPDVDGVSGPDLIVAHRDPDSSGAFTVTVLLNNGDATFQAAVSYVVGDTPLQVIAGDFDGVNGPDLAVANKQDDTVSVLRNNGDGTFAGTVSYAVGNGPLAIAAADLDGDQDTDLAVVESGSDSVRVLLNDGAGVFSFGASLLVGAGPTAIVAVDLEADGDRDLAVATAGTLAAPAGMISVLLNLGNAVFAPEIQLPAGALAPVAITASDFDGNGDADLATAHALATGTTSVTLGRVTHSSLDSNLNLVPDECDAAAGGNGWIFSGVAQGGTVDTTVAGAHLVVPTTSGQSAAAIAMALAAAINADPLLSAAGIGALVAGSTVTTNGAITSTTITDPGIDYSAAISSIPALSRPEIGLLLVLLLWVTSRMRHRPAPIPRPRRSGAA
ncbi:MAG: FG-GAP repeat domain-containing protein, partial [Planctomycetota bacterium]